MGEIQLTGLYGVSLEMGRVGLYVFTFVGVFPGKRPTRDFVGYTRGPVHGICMEREISNQNFRIPKESRFFPMPYGTATVFYTLKNYHFEPNVMEVWLVQIIFLSQLRVNF